MPTFCELHGYSRALDIGPLPFNNCSLKGTVEGTCTYDYLNTHRIFPCHHQDRGCSMTVVSESARRVVL